MARLSRDARHADGWLPKAQNMLLREEGASKETSLSRWTLRLSCCEGLVNIQENLLAVENPDSKYCLLLNNL